MTPLDWKVAPWGLHTKSLRKAGAGGPKRPSESQSPNDNPVERGSASWRSSLGFLIGGWGRVSTFPVLRTWEVVSRLFPGKPGTLGCHDLLEN